MRRTITIISNRHISKSSHNNSNGILNSLKSRSKQPRKMKSLLSLPAGVNTLIPILDSFTTTIRPTARRLGTVRSLQRKIHSKRRQNPRGSRSKNQSNTNHRSHLILTASNRNKTTGCRKKNRRNLQTMNREDGTNHPRLMSRTPTDGINKGKTTVPTGGTIKHDQSRSSGRIMAVFLLKS